MTKTTTNVKTPKTITIKVKTIWITVGIVIALVASFYAGASTAKGYTDKVTNDAVSLVKKLK